MTDSDSPTGHRPAQNPPAAKASAEDAQASEDETVQDDGPPPTTDHTQMSGDWVPL